MKNADMPAMPQSATNEGYGCNYTGSFNGEVPTGLTKREMFAMHAPECSKLFKRRFAMERFDDDNIVKKISLDYNPKTKCEEWTSELTLLGELEAQKEWRYLYADMMLNDLEK